MTPRNQQDEFEQILVTFDAPEIAAAIGRVASPVQQLNGGLPLVPVETENEQVEVPDQTQHEENLKKISAGQRCEDKPPPVFWATGATVQEHTDGILRTKEGKVIQLEAEMSRMQKTINELQHMKDPQPTPT